MKKNTKDRRKKAIKLDIGEKRGKGLDRRVDLGSRQAISGLYQIYCRSFNNFRNPKNKIPLGQGASAQDLGVFSGEPIAVQLGQTDANSILRSAPRLEHEFAVEMQKKGEITDAVGNVVNRITKKSISNKMLYWKVA